MKLLSIAAVVLAGTVACSDNAPPTSPSTQPTTARFTTQLSPANEVPPVTNGDVTASGTTTITLNLTRDAAGANTAAHANITTAGAGFRETTYVPV